MTPPISPLQKLKEALRGRKWSSDPAIQAARAYILSLEKEQAASGKEDALVLAIRFHETYERLAPSFGYETRTDTKVFDPESKNGKLMVAVCSTLTAENAALREEVKRGEEKLREATIKLHQIREILVN